MRMARFRQWDREEIVLGDGARVMAIAPVILSASRATDIPAFHADWFMERLREGWFQWQNPFNAAQVQYVSTARARVIVFWSKNPEPLLRHLGELDRLGLHYYFQFTLNDYEAEGYEPRVPPLARRIEIFRRLADRIGPDRVIWRMDPLLLSDRVGMAELLARAEAIGARLAGHTRKLVFSYADIAAYGTVRRNLKRAGVPVREFTPDEMNEAARGLVRMARANGISEIATCAEDLDQTSLGVTHNRCVDDDLMMRLWPEDQPLMKWVCCGETLLLADGVRPRLKDNGQRKACGCIVSKDIGRYGTCFHHCVYCYATYAQAPASLGSDRG